MKINGIELKETRSQERLLNELIKAGAEWPDICSHITQDKDGEVRGFTCKPRRAWKTNHWSPKVDNCCITIFHPESTIPNWHQTIITREQYEARDGWITWHGGGCPVDEGVRAEIITSTSANEGDAGRFNWSHEACSVNSRIIAYRIHKPVEQPAPAREPVEKTIPLSPTIEQLIEQWRSDEAGVDAAKDKAAKSREAVEDALAAAGWITK